MHGAEAPPGFEQMRLVLLQHGGLASLTGKTGLAMLRHRQGPIVAVVDPDHAGQSLQQITGIDRDVPVVADLPVAMAFAPEVAVIGLAPSGGGCRILCAGMFWLLCDRGCIWPVDCTLSSPRTLNWLLPVVPIAGSGIYDGNLQALAWPRLERLSSSVIASWPSEQTWLSAK